MDFNLASELVWLPSRRACPKSTVLEPTRFTYRPPFVPRRGAHICCQSATSFPAVREPCREEFDRRANTLRSNGWRASAKLERDVAAQMVLDLERWERDHLRKDAVCGRLGVESFCQRGNAR